MNRVSQSLLRTYCESASEICTTGGLIDEAVATACCVTNVLIQAEAMQQMCCFVQAYKCSRMCSDVQEVSLHVLQTEQADNLTWVAHTSCSQTAYDHILCHYSQHMGSC